MPHPVEVAQGVSCWVEDGSFFNTCIDAARLSSVFKVLPGKPRVNQERFTMMVEKDSRATILVHPRIEVECREGPRQPDQKLVVRLEPVHLESGSQQLSWMTYEVVLRCQGKPFEYPRLEPFAYLGSVHDCEKWIGHERMMTPDRDNSAVRHTAVHVSMVNDVLQQSGQRRNAGHECVLINVALRT